MGHDWKSRLSEAVTQSGRSMRSISMQAGLSPNYLRMVLRHGRNPSIDNLSAIACALNVHIHSFLREQHGNPAAAQNNGEAGTAP